MLLYIKIIRLLLLPKTNMSTETLPPPIQDPTIEQLPPAVPLPEQPVAAESDYLGPRNNLSTDVAKPLAEEYYTAPETFYADNPLEKPPDTPTAFSQRWGQLQGTWQRVKAGVHGATVGRLRALKRGEAYDATKHNRVVQNEMYQSIGDLAVREHLFAHDTKRFNRYASHKLTRGEYLRQNLEEMGSLVPIVGVLALRGAGKLLLRNSKLESVGSYVGLAAAESADKALSSLKKSSKHVTAAHARKRAVSQAVVGAQQNARAKAAWM